MKKILFSALVGAMMISCSRDNDNTNPTTPQTPATNETGILPVKFISSIPGKVNEITIFSYNGNKLEKIFDNGIVWNVVYNGDFISYMHGDNGDFYEFHYDSNGNLISEKHKSTEKKYNIIYSFSESSLTAQKKSQEFNENGVLQYTINSNITYTLDSQKKPIKKIETSQRKFHLTNQDIKVIATSHYSNYNYFLKNIKGMDKLIYSHSNFIPQLFDYESIESNNSTFKVKAEYIVNTYNYPTKIVYKTEHPATGKYEDIAYFTIEYNK